MSGIPPSYFQCDLEQLESQWQAYKARSGIPAMTITDQDIFDALRRIRDDATLVSEAVKAVPSAEREPWMNSLATHLDRAAGAANRSLNMGAAE